VLAEINAQLDKEGSVPYSIFSLSSRKK
jgi:hypothetical protein